jgi:hypothetical protein
MMWINVAQDEDQESIILSTTKSAGFLHKRRKYKLFKSGSTSSQLGFG